MRLFSVLEKYKIEQEMLVLHPDTNMADASEAFITKDAGAALVVDGDEPIFQSVKGIITKTDVVRCIAQGRCPTRMKVADAMTTHLVVATVEDDVEYALKTMARHKITHVPVIRQPKVVAIISAGDLIRVKYEESKDSVRYLRDFLGGTYGNTVY